MRLHGLRLSPRWLHRDRRVNRTQKNWSLDLAATLASVLIIVILLPFLPGIVMADGMKSLVVLAGIEAFLLGVFLLTTNELLVPQTALKSAPID